MSLSSTGNSTSTAAFLRRTMSREATRHPSAHAVALECCDAPEFTWGVNRHGQRVDHSVSWLTAPDLMQTPLWIRLRMAAQIRRMLGSPQGDDQAQHSGQDHADTAVTISQDDLLPHGWTRQQISQHMASALAVALADRALMLEPREPAASSLPAAALLACCVMTSFATGLVLAGIATLV